MPLLYVIQETTCLFERKRRQSSTHPAEPSAPDVAIARPVRINDRVRVSIECARLQLAMPVKKLAIVSGISEDTLRAYEAGTAFPDARDISTLQTHLRCEIVP